MLIFNSFYMLDCETLQNSLYSCVYIAGSNSEQLPPRSSKEKSLYLSLKANFQCRTFVSPFWQFPRLHIDDVSMCSKSLS